MIGLNAPYVAIVPQIDLTSPDNLNEIRKYVCEFDEFEL